MYHRIQSVKPSGEWTFDAVFLNGEMRRFDVRPLIERWSVFRALREVPGLFGLVHVDAGGYAVAWNDELDLECETVWEEGSVPAAQ